MRLGKNLKRDTKLIIISVLILTLVTLSVSYSAIFSVQSKSTVQQITTGTLNVAIHSSSAAMGNNELFPTPEAELPTPSKLNVPGDYAKLYLTNTGSLTADYSISIGYDYDSMPNGTSEADLIPLRYIKVGIYRENPAVGESVWYNFGTNASPEYYTTITRLVASETNVYPILRSQIAGLTSSPKQYRVYVWLSEDTPITEIGKLIYLKIDVKSTTVEEQL